MSLLKNTKCPKCQGYLVLLSSKNLKVCIDCKAEYPWELGSGQKPLVNTNRGDRKYSE